MALAPLTDVELTFLRELQGRGIRFAVVGMGAAVLQGATAVTQDLDLRFEDPTDPRNAEAARSVKALRLRVLRDPRFRQETPFAETRSGTGSTW